MRSHKQLITGLGLAVALALTVLAGQPTSAAAQQDDVPAWAYQLPHDLMSPYCPGRTLAACTSPQAAELRQRIILQAAAGASEADIETQLRAEFGDRISPIPTAEGWGATTFVIPLAGFAVGAIVVVFAMRRLTGTGRAGDGGEELQEDPSPRISEASASASDGLGASAPPMTDEELEAEVERELRLSA